MALTDRDLRKISNTKQNSIEFQGKPSVHNMVDGQIAIERKSNSQLALYRKKYGKLWKSYMSSDGNLYVDKALKADTLEYINRFVDYRTFSHNFTKDLDTTKTYLPWWNTDDLTSLRGSVGYLAPFNMTCQKLIFKPPDLDDNADDIEFGIDKIDDGDNTVDSLCTYTYTTSFTDYTSITINQSDWSATPSVEAGDVVAISVDASHADIVTSAKGFWVTSVWRVDVVI
mgnify:CR=1 FL=1